MPKGPTSETFTAAAGFEEALRQIRAALRREGLCAAAELDITARIRQELGAGVASCRVLYVDDPALLLEAVVFHRGAGLLIPQPLVVTGDARHTEFVFRRREMLAAESPESIRDPLFDLLRRLERALESIAERQGVFPATPVAGLAS